jgi:hypothetical protein
MNRIEINNFLVQIGWTKYSTPPDTAQIIRVEDRIVRARVINSTSEVAFDPVTVSNDVFDKFEHVISASDIDYYTGKIIRRRYADGSVINITQLSIRKQDYGLEDIANMSSQAIEWALNVDIESCLAELRAQPISAIGPHRHLTSLAVAGDVKTLGHYRDRFAAGDRMDCVPYITIDYINRALDLAEKRKADPTWVPERPKIRV